MNRLIGWIGRAGAALLSLAPLCADAAPPIRPVAPSPPTDQQLARCDRPARRGQPTPWWCGGREVEAPPGFAAACDDRQWIGYRLDAPACPPAPSAAGTWTVTEPFAVSRDLDLRRICVYTWAPAVIERPAPDVAALPDLPGLRLDRDCDVVGAHAFADPVKEALFEGWASQVELPDWSGAERVAVRPTRVAVIDGGYGGALFPVPPDTFPHPEAVSSVIRAAACPDRGAGPLCAATVPNYNALYYVRRGIPGELGGFFGTQGEFAAAVTEAVDAWRLEPDVTRPAHLILNLSIGWDAQYGLEAAERLPALAAFWAARYAACEGALLIAAAGNKAAEGDRGPLFPAAWESVRRECAGEPPVRRRDQPPLVYAVGGVDPRDAPLAVAREDAMPALVAPAAAVVAPLDTLIAVDEPTVVMTGTSMAAAVASGTAALIWSLRPELDADEVMALIYASGAPIGPKADFGLKPLRPQHRLSVAQAFAAACPEGQVLGACPAAASRPALPPARPAGVDASPDYAFIDALLFANAVPVSVDPNAPPAEGNSDYLEPFVVPQPNSPNCPVCGFYGTTLKGQLDPLLVGANLGTPTVKVKLQGGQLLDIKIGALPQNGPFSVDLSGPLAGKLPETGWLQIPLTDSGKTTLTSSELFVY